MAASGATCNYDFKEKIKWQKQEQSFAGNFQSQPDPKHLFYWLHSSTR